MQPAQRQEAIVTETYSIFNIYLAIIIAVTSLSLRTCHTVFKHSMKSKRTFLDKTCEPN